MQDLIYSRRADNTELTLDQIAKLAPAALAATPIEGVSARYGHYNTLESIQILGDMGWKPVQAAQRQSKDPIKKRHTMHLVSFAHERDLQQPDYAEGRPEIIVYGSSDRTSARKIYAGFFRWICSNSLVAGEGFASKCNHSKYAIKGFNDLLIDVADRLPDMGDQIEAMKSTNISTAHALYLAEESAKSRWQSLKEVNARTNLEDDLPRGTYFQPSIGQDLLKPRRWNERDIKRTNTINLWDCFNRVQEGLMRGGSELLTITKKSPNGSFRTSSAIKSVTESMRLNRTLWDTFAPLAVAA